MALYATVGGGGKAFDPPPEGVHRAVCVDVIDLGVQYSDRFKKDEHKVQLVFELDPEVGSRDDGRPFIVSRRFTLSLHEKARLRSFVDAWRGKKLADAEATKFDLESLMGKCGQLSLTHRAADGGKVFADISGILPLGKGQEPIEPSGKYIRKADKEAAN